MSSQPISQRINAIANTMTRFLQYQTVYEQQVHKPDVANFAFGNPHEMPLPEFVKALQRSIEPQNQDWFAYKLSEPSSQEVIAASLRKSHQMPFEPQDITMTNGAFAAISVALRAVVDPGDEVIFI